MTDNRSRSPVSGSAITYTWDNGVTDGTPFTQAVGTITYTVTGVDGNGCQNTDQADVTIHPLPIVSFNNAFPVLCDNDPVHTMNEGNPAGGVYSGTGVAGNNFDPSVALSGNHTITYTYTDINGCMDNATQIFTVNPSPAVVASADVTICEGDTTVLSATGATFYNWDNGLGAGTPKDAFPTTTTTYTVLGVGGNGCQNSDMVTVTVNPLPNVVLANIPPLCADGPPYTFVEGTPAGGTYSGPGVSGGQITQGIAGVGIHEIVYMYTDGFGCTDSDTNTIEIYDSPTVTANASATSLCDGDPLTLTGSGADSYSWDNGVTDGVTFVPGIGGVMYTVIGFDVNGCANIDSIYVDVHALPTVGAGPDQTVCDGDAVSAFRNRSIILFMG